MKLFAIQILLFFSCLQAKAETTTIIADADLMERNTPKKTLKLKGNVNVIFQQQHLLCDEAIIYEDTKTIIASGHVVLQNARSTFRGDKINFNYESNIGTLYGGVITSGQVLIESDVIEKVGEEEYIGNDAYYTACLTCPPSWGFTSSRVRAEIGGYAYISSPWLHILQFPVLPLPYLVVPLNSKRQTGFLVPQPFSNANLGLSLEMPFFWAIDRSHDATFSLVSYEKKGLQVHGNYRYVMSPESSGELSLGYMKDRANDYTDRWFMQYNHRYKLPNNYTQQMKLAMTSDRFYATDFFRHFNYIGRPALDNNVALSKSMEESVLTVDSSYYVSLIEAPFELDHENASSLHRMPEINYNLLDQKISEDYNLFFSFDAQYINITRQGLAFENTRSDTACAVGSVCYVNPHPSGNFIYGPDESSPVTNNQEYGDLIRTGQRLDLKPRFHAPFWIGSVLDVDPSVTFRYTQYSLGVESDDSQGYDSFPSRFYVQYDLSTKSYLSHIYQWNEDTKIKHSIIPEIDLKYIPIIHQTEHNFFGTSENLQYFREQQPIDDSDADWRNGGRGIQFDNNDRVRGKQLVNFSLTNKVISLTENASLGTNLINSQYTQNLYFNVSQAFDINEARRGGEARPWQDIQTRTTLITGPMNHTIHTSTFPYHNRTRWGISSSYRFLFNNYFKVGYTKTYQILLRPPVDENTKQEFLNFTTGLSLPYVYLFARVAYDLNANEAAGDEKLPAWTVTANITPPGSCWTIDFGLSKVAPRTPPTPRVDFEFKFSE